jgi:hypothetical protein
MDGQEILCEIGAILFSPCFTRWLVLNFIKPSAAVERLPFHLLEEIFHALGLDIEFDRFTLADL